MTLTSMSAAALAFMKLGAESVREADNVVTFAPHDLDISEYPAALEMAEKELLAELKRNLIDMVDAAAETERQRYITQGAGQALTYQRKVDEARRAAAEEDPKAVDYPFLCASLGIDGDSIAAVAQTVLSMDALWAQIGSAIEAERLRAKAAIGAAKSAAEAQSAFASIVWPSV
jgi:hypothetical protein